MGPRVEKGARPMIRAGPIVIRDKVHGFLLLRLTSEDVRGRVERLGLELKAILIEILPLSHGRQ